MKRLCAIACILGFCGTVPAQDSDVTEETTETTVLSGADLTSELWLMDDATPIATGAADLRMTFRWVTASAPANMGDSDDDFVFGPSLRWGPCKNVEVFASIPIWLGDGGDMGAVEDGNGDTYVGFTWRLLEPRDIWPALALGAGARIPTGDGSSGVDAELRLILTNEYDSGMRSHINLGFETEGSDWGRWAFVGVIGMDGPLCADGAVRWVADYVLLDSEYMGGDDAHYLELGSEWQIQEGHKLGLMWQFGFHHDETTNFGANLVYALSIM